MSRIRNIKPAFFKDSELFDAEQDSGLPLRVAYAGLWTVADRMGRFRWKPREIKTDILPYDNIDMALVLDALVKYGFIFKYKVAGFEYGFIPSFEKHQFINRNEAQSTLPAPPENSNAQSLTNSEPTPDEKAPEIHSEYTASSDFLTQTQTQTFQTLETRAPKSARSPKGSRWPSEAVVPEDWLRSGEASRRENGLVDIDLALEALRFQNYWAAKSGGSSTKVDWLKTWINWALKAEPPRINTRESSHDKGTRGAALFLAEVEARDRARGHDSAGNPVDRVPPTGHDDGEVEGPLRNLLRGPETSEFRGAPVRLHAISAKSGE